MFLVKPEIPATEKTTDTHPWAGCIKDEYSNAIKYAHNSIRNPRYPNKKKKDKESTNQKLIKFSIIGDRVTKEFIYCYNLVKGLYKYRKSMFEAPVIRGATTVEWPAVWDDLKVRYGGLAYCITSSVAVLVNNKFLGGEKELKELVESKFIYHLTLNYYKESIAEFAKFIRGSGRPCVYMKISIDGEDIGTFIFMLFSDILPNTCANFLRMCNTTKGGYSGTPIHRIVKDGWIQCGGYGLKETDIDCENFVIPHDRRGVLGMANSGLHVECSTQFFVLLQPAPWMANKFVAFGQLIEGKETLEKVEAVPTFYESPNSKIIIYKAGIFNMECHDIMVNKCTNEYIDKHIEDLNELGELFYEKLLENVFLTAQLRALERLKQEHEGEGDENEGAAGLHATKRFNRNKEDIEKQLQSSKDGPSRNSPAIGHATGSPAPRPTSTTDDNENNDFDVETYDPEFEGTDYQHQSIDTPSLIVKPKKPFYIPLTDVLYPGEKDSNFDLKRFLQGDYCLETDLTEPAKTFIPQDIHLHYYDMYDMEEGDEEDGDNHEDKEMESFLKNDVDHVSFAGNIVRKIGTVKETFNMFDDRQCTEMITDDRLRRLRLAALDRIQEHEKKVSISMPNEKSTHIQIKRRQTGFVRPQDLAKLLSMANWDDEDDDVDDDNDNNINGDNVDGEVCMAPETKKELTTPAEDICQGTTFVPKAAFIDGDADDDDTLDSKQMVQITATTERPTANQANRQVTVNLENVDDDDDDHFGDIRQYNFTEPDTRHSVLNRLLDEVKGDEEPPTLKDFKPLSERQPKTFLTYSPPRMRSDSDSRNQQRYQRRSLSFNDSCANALNMQHALKLGRKMSTDYAKTIDQIEHTVEHSIRTVEFAKKRPTITVSEYQLKNKKYKEAQKSLEIQISDHQLPLAHEKVSIRFGDGLRLPGDTPLHSSEYLHKEEKLKEKLTTTAVIFVNNSLENKLKYDLVVYF